MANAVISKENDPVLPPLDSIRLEWLFAAAQDHFVEMIEKYELQIMRHRAASDDKFYTQSIVGPKKRAEDIERKENFIAHYRQIIEFCCIIRTRLMELSAEQFAESLKPYFEQIKNAQRDKKKA